MVKVLNQVSGDRFSLYHADCVEGVAGLPDNSIHHTITSVPFSNLYTYSPSLRDMGNVESDEMFMRNIDYLIPELWRVTVPGRVAAIHCKQLPLFKGRDEVAGLRDFPGELRRRFCGEAIEYLQARLEALEEARSLLVGYDGDVLPLEVKIRDVQKELVAAQSQRWVFHGMVTIWKCPKTEMEKTNNHGLLHTQLCKDSSVSRPGMAEYVYLFRKWSDEMEGGIQSIAPVSRHTPEQMKELKKQGKEHKWTEYAGSNPPTSNNPRDFSIKTWQKYASPVWNDVWMDINSTKVLNQKLVAKNRQVRHICPLQTQVVDRLVDWFTNPGEVVLDPFNGIGTTGVRALQHDRRYVGFELNKEYFEIATEFLRDAENKEQLVLAM